MPNENVPDTEMAFSLDSRSLRALNDFVTSLTNESFQILAPGVDPGKKNAARVCLSGGRGVCAATSTFLWLLNIAKLRSYGKIRGEAACATHHNIIMFGDSTSSKSVDTGAVN